MRLSPLKVIIISKNVRIDIHIWSGGGGMFWIFPKVDSFRPNWRWNNDEKYLGSLNIGILSGEVCIKTWKTSSLECKSVYLAPTWAWLPPEILEILWIYWRASELLLETYHPRHHLILALRLRRLVHTHKLHLGCAASLLSLIRCDKIQIYHFWYFPQ